MRHHLVVLRAGLDVTRPPHDAGNAPAALEGRALLAAERRRAGVGIGVQPGAVVGRHDDDRVGRLGADRVHDPADVGVELHQRIGVVAEMRLALELRRGVGRVVHLEEVDVHEERLVVVGVLLDVVDRRVGLPDVEGRERIVGDRADLLGRLAGHALPLAEVHDAVVAFSKSGLYDGNQGWNHLEVSL